MRVQVISVPVVLGALLLASCQSKPAEESAPEAKAAAGAPATPVPTAESKPTKPAMEPIPAPADVAAAPADAEASASGLKSKVLQKGTGAEKPGPEDTVSVHYTGWSKDGQMFDSSVARGRPSRFKVQGVIKGWTEALQMMVVGEKRRLWIPGDLAYGEKPRRNGPFGQLTFDVELLEVIKAPPPPETPKDVAAPPKDAKRTKSGLAYRVLDEGTGTVSPKATDRVRVHYTGWTTDGKMFDSSVTRGQPATFGLNQVIAGWTEGVQLMKEGQKVRFWIPGSLAYGDTPKRPGAPAGMLVFDIELIKVMGSMPTGMPPGHP